MSLVKIAKFIAEHPLRNKVCPDMELGNIFTLIIRCLQEDGLIIATNEEGDIEGIVAGYPIPQNKTFYIEILLINNNKKNVVRKLLSGFNTKYSGYNIEATRYKTFVKYNTPRLLSLISKLSI